MTLRDAKMLKKKKPLNTFGNALTVENLNPNRLINVPNVEHHRIKSRDTITGTGRSKGILFEKWPDQRPGGIEFC